MNPDQDVAGRQAVRVGRHRMKDVGDDLHFD